MLKSLGLGLMMTATFLGYSVLFSYAHGLSPTDAAKIVVTGGLNKDPISIYRRAMAEIDSIETAKFEYFKTVEDSLANEKRKINTEKAEVQAIRDDISRLTDLKKKMEDASLYSLAKIYNDMDPTQLSNIMYDLDDSMIVAVLPKMKNDKASKILEMLPPGRSAKISSMLLGKE